MKTIFGARINSELSYRKKDALKNKDNLFMFANSKSIEGLTFWRNHLESKNVPFIVAFDKKSFRPFVILKRQFIYDKDSGGFRVKGCKCNPISREGCLICRPHISATNLRKRLNSDGKKWRSGRKPGRPKV